MNILQICSVKILTKIYSRSTCNHLSSLSPRSKFPLSKTVLTWTFPYLLTAVAAQILAAATVVTSQMTPYPFTLAAATVVPSHKTPHPFTLAAATVETSQKTPHPFTLAAATVVPSQKTPHPFTLAPIPTPCLNICGAYLLDHFHVVLVAAAAVQINDRTGW